jgi:hypothetical protein
MNRRLALLPLLALAGTSLSGCVAVAIPALAGSAMFGSRVLDNEDDKAPANPALPVIATAPASAPVAAPPTPAAWADQESTDRLSAMLRAAEFEIAWLADMSVEVARFSVDHDGPATCLIQPDRQAEPEIFGMLTVDAIRQAALAYPQSHGVPEAAALVPICEGLDAESGDPSTPIKPLQDYGKLN